MLRVLNKRVDFIAIQNATLSHYLSGKYASKVGKLKVKSEPEALSTFYCFIHVCSQPN